VTAVIAITAPSSLLATGCREQAIGPSQGERRHSRYPAPDDDHEQARAPARLLREGRRPVPKTRGEHRREQRSRRTANLPPGARAGAQLPWGKITLGVAALLAVAGLAYVAVTGAGSSTVNPQLEALARETSGGEVRVLRGSAHTVYHSDATLPTSNEPRADGLPTLVWFSGTWCHFCERMDPFAWETASGFADQLIFLEKSVDHDRGAASRFGVRGSPTFVMLDARGREIARFFYQADPTSFASTIESALARVGVG